LFFEKPKSSENGGSGFFRCTGEYSRQVPVEVDREPLLAFNRCQYHLVDKASQQLGGRSCGGGGEPGRDAADAGARAARRAATNQEILAAAQGEPRPVYLNSRNQEQCR